MYVPRLAKAIVTFHCIRCHLHEESTRHVHSTASVYSTPCFLFSLSLFISICLSFFSLLSLRHFCFSHLLHFCFALGPFRFYSVFAFSTLALSTPPIRCSQVHSTPHQCLPSAMQTALQCAPKLATHLFCFGLFSIHYGSVFGLATTLWLRA